MNRVKVRSGETVKCTIDNLKISPSSGLGREKGARNPCQIPIFFFSETSQNIIVITRKAKKANSQFL